MRAVVNAQIIAPALVRTPASSSSNSNQQDGPDCNSQKRPASDPPPYCLAEERGSRSVAAVPQQGLLVPACDAQFSVEPVRADTTRNSPFG
jgi:hypothetical protein